MRLDKLGAMTCFLVILLCGTPGGLGHPLQKERPSELRAKMSNEERTALSRQETNNDKIKTYLRFAEQRLRSARVLVDKDEHAEAGKEVVGYATLIADAGIFTRASVPKRDKAHKTLETALREQYRVLEGLKRDIGVSQVAVMEEALRIVVKVRRQSLNLFLGEDKVLSESEKP